MSKSLKEAAKKPGANPWYRAVYRGDEPVGFVMLSWKPPSGPFKGRHFIWRLLVDKRYQRRGIGEEALTQIAALVRADGATELLTSYEPGDGEARTVLTAGGHMFSPVHGRSGETRSRPACVVSHQVRAPESHVRQTCRVFGISGRSRSHSTYPA
ncbi:GNAT family N-acetyltransferase [Streptomyces mirabilis]|uniref:GNAT family N-acetyltransferase n=1 Tax=Streptomyces mirabilis TaxID=68239 RepID=UPI003323D060